MSKYTPRSSHAQVSPISSRSRVSSGGQQASDYEEFASLQLDRPNEGELKTSEEMKRHLFEDHFEGRPIERAMHILAVGDEVQRVSVIRDLLALIQADERGCLQRVITKIQQALSSASTEFHLEAARSYSTVLEKKAVTSNTFAQAFLPSVIFHVDNRDQVVSSAWLDTLLKATELLPVEILRHEILNAAINKGQISQSVWHRTAACKLLGKMCSRFDSHTVKKDILPVVLSLCQDVNESVRACICSQLHLVAKGLPQDMVKPALIPILVELGRDETVQVRVEATQTIVNIIPFVSQDVLKVTIIPLMKKICEQAVLSLDDTLVMVAKQFGALCIGLENALTSAEKLWMVTYYHNLSHMGIPMHGPKKDVYVTNYNTERLYSRYIECRQYCAYNFPAMAKFCSSSPELLEKLYPSFFDFATDPYYMVRKTIGAGIHEVARILGSQNKVVKNNVMTLLWDNMEEVLMGIVPQLSKTIESLVSTGVLGIEQEGVSYELGRGLLQCDKTIREHTHNWRLYTDFITQLESIVKCLPSDYIYSHFVSLMFDKMHRARPLPCRLAAARTLLVFLRYNLKNSQRQEIRSRLQLEFCSSSSCYKRMLYLRLCNSAREVFSRAYFKEHFFYPLLSRSEDKVPNNRLLLIRQFPSLKALIVMPSEKKYLQTLETCIRSMAISEKDRDVTAELRTLIHRMDRTETLSDNATSQTPDDVEDRRKYDEEMRVANAITRPGPGFQMPPTESKKGATTKQEAKPVNKSSGSKINSAPSSSSTASNISPRNGKVGHYVNPSSSSVSYSSVTPHDSFSHGSFQGFTNTTNNKYTVRASLGNVKTNTIQNCTCFSSNFRSENLRNLNLLALIDTNFVNSKKKLSETLKQKLSEDPHFKMSRLSKHNMEISWLNLETDLQNELCSLMKNRHIHGDRNLKEKSKFLSDFRNYNESTLSKFINEDRDFKETIYSVTGVGVTNYYERPDPNYFEERINFFERKIKLDDSKNNGTNFADCSCYELTTTNRGKLMDFEETKKFSFFSKNFEEDFYRDAGVKANEIIGKKFSGIPMYDKPTQISSPKITSVTNRRRTWFGNENLSQGSVKLENITGYKINERKKSETLPARENISLKKLGIGPRSKSFILPSTLIYSDKQVSSIQSTKLIFDKENDSLKSDSEKEITDGNPKLRSESDRFGFRSRTSIKVESKIEKPQLKTKIPIGKVGNGSGSAGSRSSSPGTVKDKTEAEAKHQTNGTKKIPVVVSRKSMFIQSNSVKTEMKSNRRSLDSTKISLASMDKPHSTKRRNEKVLGKVKNGENGTITQGSEAKNEKVEGEAVSIANSSKLPIRRQKSDK